MKAKVLLLDIETAPALAYVWKVWQENVGLKQLLERPYLMSYAAKWLDDSYICYEENRHNNDAGIVKSLFDLLDEADVVVGHNGDKFDLPMIIGRGLVHGFKPPSPYHTVDTLKIARKKFRFLSNSLASLCVELNLPRKLEHSKFSGFELWLQCIKQNDAAWDELRDYNIQDVVSLEALYKKFLPYITTHPNTSRKTGDEVCQCPNCSSEHVRLRGFYYTKAGLAYQRFVCKDCGTWSHSKTALKEAGKNVLRNC